MGGLVVVVREKKRRRVLEQRAAAIALLLLFGAKVHFAYNLGKHLVDVGLVLGAGLDERTTPLRRQRVALRVRHLALVLQVDLVGDEQNGHAFVALDARNQVLHLFDILEGLVVGEAVDDDEALPVLDVEVAHAGKLLRAGGVEDLQHARRVIHFDLLAIKVLYRRVVLLHEATRHKLHRQRTLPNPTRAEHHYFELTHLCCCFPMALPAFARALRAHEFRYGPRRVLILLDTAGHYRGIRKPER